jgi:hypothetical protein
VGYKAHLTETCDEGRPRLIVEAETTAAPVPDNQVVEGLHNKLRAKKLLPKQHLVDAGYVGAGLIVSSKKLHKIDLCGPSLARIIHEPSAILLKNPRFAFNHSISGLQTSFDELPWQNIDVLDAVASAKVSEMRF